MTTHEIINPINETRRKLIEIVVCDSQWKLAAQRLDMEVEELHRFRIDHAKELAALQYDVYLSELAQKLRDELLNMETAQVMQAFRDVKGTPTIIAPNIKQPGDLIPGEGAFDDLDTPRNKLLGELERLQALRNGGGNGDG